MPSVQRVITFILMLLWPPIGLLAIISWIIPLINTPNIPALPAIIYILYLVGWIVDYGFAFRDMGKWASEDS